MDEGRLEMTWGAATRTCPGETTTGDVGLVLDAAGGVLVAAFDGLGHGEQAAVAAETARDVLRERAGPRLRAILVACHEALRATRGASVGIAFFSPAAASLEWAGVGNVTGVVVAGAPGGAEPRWLGFDGGLAGHALPDTRVVRLALRHGDVLIVVTDGVRPAFARDLGLAGGPEEIAERILAGHWTGRDDAIAVVARFLAAPG
jgi:phosphoserine phosphatase RsbX